MTDWNHTPQARWQEKKRKLGLCVSCGKNKTKFVLCLSCARKQATRSKVNRDKRKRKERINNGYNKIEVA